MNDDNMKMEGRRAFLRSTSLLLTGTTAYAVMPNFAWAANDMRLQHLAKVGYVMYPHSQVPEKFYMASAKGLMDKAAVDSKLEKMLDEGKAMLDSVYSVPFVKLSPEDQDLALQRTVGTPYFQTVRGHTVVGLYNIPEIWQYFGYQGPSYSKGGYINRGLDDVFWLQDV